MCCQKRPYIHPPITAAQLSTQELLTEGLLEKLSTNFHLRRQYLHSSISFNTQPNSTNSNISNRSIKEAGMDSKLNHQICLNF